jgi:hypothetical protein
MRALALLLVAAAAAACSKSDPPPAPTGSGSVEARPTIVPAAEIARAKEACDAYVTRACECAKTVPAAVKVCELSHGEPEAIRISLEVSQSPDSSPKDALDAQHNVRKIAKSCVEEPAKLPELGCPP